MQELNPPEPIILKSIPSPIALDITNKDGGKLTLKTVLFHWDTPEV
jgi:hypothetical protein